ncbi:hypothetical protein [Pelagicoccus albus]|uniref:Uncharacterized protein n=1 Tax=Pelagicoccus albus TaxID=415222 RepID=A0A7X1B9S5_9BACT|nr:hypothetical protein [Pelagicoccus albus]MBC2608206.1 hypothetical protein [Pelagicoccus albus]
MKDRQTILSSLMETVGLAPRKGLSPGAGRFLGMGGSFGKAKIRHCTTWDFEYKLPRVPGREQFNDTRFR